MPAFVAPNAMTAVAKGTILGQPWVNTFGIRSGPNGASGGFFLDQTAANAIGGAVRAFYDGLKSDFTTGWDLDEVVVVDHQSTTAPAYDAVITPVVGTHTGTPMPPNMAIVATHLTGMRGKSYRGRTYLAGFTTGALVAGGVISGPNVTRIETAYTGFRTALGAIATGDLRHAVVSRALGIATQIVETNVNTAFDHQDRRKVT